ncbi:MAG: pantetheine-phosphate adenylyltransferase [Crocinitomicaceae bacterium]|nr:pantetheine-phosphate adenylyltransferase [Crocinitomicaceae bacterium]
MQRIAVFAGSFDPFTKGHESVINRFVPLFDSIIIAVGINSTKQYMFSLESRLKHIESLCKTYPNVSVETYAGLTVDFCKLKKAQYLIRGIRNTTDFEFEKSIAQMNKTLSGIETVFLITEPDVAPIHSSIVREIKKNNGDISQFVTNNELLIITTK